MATPQDSMVAGLFTTPEQYQQQRQAVQRAQAIQMASLDPFQQGQANIQMGFNRLADVGAGALGIQDPMLKMQSMRQQAVQGMDPTDPESIMQAAQRLASIDPANASRLAEMSRAAALKKAQTDKALRTAGATTVSERNREMIANAEIKLAKKETLSPEEEARVRWLIGQENKPKIFRDADTGQITTIEPIDLMSSAPNLAALVGRQAAQPSVQGGDSATAPATATTAPTTTRGVTGTITTTPATRLPTSIQKEVGDIDQNLTRLQNSVTTIDSLSTKIDEVNLGLVDNLERGIRGFFGRPTEDTQAFKQLQREMRKQANELLLLAKGVATEGDAQRARDQLDDPDTWKNAKLLKAAFDDLKDTQKKTQKELLAKRTTLTSSGIPAIPGLGAGDIAPNRSSMSGMNPQLQPAAETPATPKGKPITQEVMNKANDAIKRGAPRDAVMKRLKDQGYAVQ
jgi:hypothetical protein